MTVRKALLMAAVLVLSVPWYPRLLTMMTTTVTTPTIGSTTNWSDAHERAHEYGFYSRHHREQARVPRAHSTLARQHQ